MRISYSDIIGSPKENLDKGILYMLVIILGDDTFIKVGITNRTIADRVVEIQRSIFTKYRYFPYIKPIRFSKVENYKRKEAEIHSLLRYCTYTPEHKFDGCTELFSLPIDEAKDIYTYIDKEGNLKGYEKNSRYV